jgi:hypothetical protein
LKIVGSAAPWLPKRFDPTALEHVRHGFFATLANSYQFFREYARIDRFDPRDPAIPPVASRNEIDRWLVSRTHVGRRRAAAPDYDLGRARSRHSSSTSSPTGTSAATGGVSGRASRAPTSSRPSRRCTARCARCRS